MKTKTLMLPLKFWCQFIRRNKAILLILAGSMVFLQVLFETSCLFRAMTGLPCPGCGSTRAIIALLSGDLARYLHYMPLAVPNVAALAYLAITYPFRGTFGKGDKALLLLVFFVNVLFFIFRMIQMFPDTEPYTINRTSMLFRSIGWLGGLIR
ncbi:MAG: DUF2752 domain-containing protein [Myxococcales bacterium]|jgi:hypothetical protein|nr:DUF2752 domain-containing protein [Myxococcales bacterium]